jgi:hypothetical protein
MEIDAIFHLRSCMLLWISQDTKGLDSCMSFLSSLNLQVLGRTGATRKIDVEIRYELKGQVATVL